jgi:ribosomal protein L19E
MPTTGEEFLYKVYMPQEKQDKQKEKAVKETIRFLISQGVIKDSKIPIQESNH